MANKIQKIDQKYFHEITVEILRHKTFRLQVDHSIKEIDHIKVAKSYSDAYIETYNALIELNK